MPTEDAPEGLAGHEEAPDGGIAQPEPRLEVGRVAKPHGLRGEVIVELVTNRTERLDPGSRLSIGELSPGQRELEVLAASAHQGRYIVAFAGVDSREAAEALRGTVLLAPPLQDPDALWAHELVGAQVVDQFGCWLGRVVSLQANPASDLLVLEGGGLVPLCFVVEHTQGQVVVDPPAGLLDPDPREHSGGRGRDG